MSFVLYCDHPTEKHPINRRQDWLEVTFSRRHMSDANNENEIETAQGHFCSWEHAADYAHERALLDPAPIGP